MTMNIVLGGDREQGQLTISCPADGWAIEKNGADKAKICLTILEDSIGAMDAPELADRIMLVARLAAALDRHIRDVWDLRELNVYEWRGAKFPFYDTDKRCLVLPVASKE